MQQMAKIYDKITVNTNVKFVKQVCINMAIFDIFERYTDMKI